MFSRAPAIALLLLPVATLAKSWMEITPHKSTRADVLRRFGEPSQRVTSGDKEVLAYAGDRAPKGTTQAQFTILRTGAVEQIVVFPRPELGLPDVEESFGRTCSAPEEDRTSFCHVRQLTDEFQVYLWYKRLGLIVFLGEDRKTVFSLVYTAPAAEGAAAQVR